MSLTPMHSLHIFATLDGLFLIFGVLANGSTAQVPGTKDHTSRAAATKALARLSKLPQFA